MNPLGLLAAVVLVAGDDDGAGYRGIKWGTDCTEARQRLEESGITFAATRWEPVEGFSSYVLAPVLAFIDPLPLHHLSELTRPFVFLGAGSAAGMRFEMLCKHDEFVGLRISSGDASSRALLKKKAGRAVATASVFAHALREVPDKVSKLTVVGDTARYLQEGTAPETKFGGPASDYVEYLLLSRGAHDELVAAVAERGKKHGNEAATRNAVREKQRDALVP